MENLNAKKVSIEASQSPNIQDHNTFEQPNKIEIKTFTDFSVKKGQLQMEIPAHSVLLVKVAAN
jgi:alpha-N-arabinofuranosidase